jgi:hypothetical protein
MIAGHTDRGVTRPVPMIRKEPTMNCFECTIVTPGIANVAIGSCAYCGAGLCTEHAYLINMPAPPVGLMPRANFGARRIVCPSCYTVPPSGGVRAGHVQTHERVPTAAMQ